MNIMGAVVGLEEQLEHNSGTRRDRDKFSEHACNQLNAHRILHGAT